MPSFKRERRPPIPSVPVAQSSSSTLSATSSTTLASIFDKHQYQRPPSPSSHSTSSSSHHSHNSSSARSRKSSQSLPENTQRSSANRRTSQSVSSSSAATGPLIASSIGAKRSPLAPLDPQATTHHDNILNDIDMANGTDEDIEGGRKSSTATILTNASRPTPFSQRITSRRPSSHSRRGSLPTSNIHVSLPPPLHGPFGTGRGQDDDLYSHLSTYTFGDAQSPRTYTAASRTEDTEAVSPLQRPSPFDLTPRGSLANTPSAAPPPGTSYTKQLPHLPPLQPPAANLIGSPIINPNTTAARHAYNSSSPSSDEDERIRDQRAKMRALDDGSRRPSLPTNEYDRSASTSTVHAGKTAMLNNNPNPTNSTSDGELDTDLEYMMVDDQDQDRLVSDRSSHRTFGENDNQPPSPYHFSHRGSDALHTPDTSYFPQRPAGPLGHARYSTFGDNSEGRIGVHPLMFDDADRSSIGDNAGRKGSLPMAIPGVRKNSASSHLYGQYVTSPAGDMGVGLNFATMDTDSPTNALSHIATTRRPSRSVDDEFSTLHNLHTQHVHPISNGAVANTSRASRSSLSHGNGPSSEPDIRGLALAQAQVQAEVEQEEAKRAHVVAQVQAHIDSARRGSIAGNTTNDIAPWDTGAASSGLATVGVAPPNELNFNNLTINVTASGNASPYEGLDLSYILSDAGPSPLPSDLARRNSAMAARKQSVTSSRGGRARESSWTSFWHFGPGAGRRPSTATVSEDTFLKFVGQYDDSYDGRRSEWSFSREKAEGEGVGLGDGERLGSEVWRCAWIGRFEVRRVLVRDVRGADPSKPPRVRLSFKHLPDPFSQGNKHGGPESLIHKHSKAKAFSIFRGHFMPKEHMRASGSILLAPRRVQEQFTSTRTTSKLNSHGLLEDERQNGATSHHHQQHEQSRQRREPPPNQDARAPGRDRAQPTVDKGKAKALNDGHTLRPQTNTAQTLVNEDGMGIERPASVGALRGQGKMADEASTIKSRSLEGPLQSTKGSGAESIQMTVLESDTSDHTWSAAEDRPAKTSPKPNEAVAASSSGVALSRSSNASQVSWEQWSASGYQQYRRIMSARALGSFASIEEPAVMRTSHAEAFQTLDPSRIEYLRNYQFDVYGNSDHDNRPQPFRALRKLFQTQPVKSMPRHVTPGGSTSAIIDSHYNPPWVLMVARTKQEEQERVLKNLNNSFRDVGLLPTYKPKSRSSNKNKKRKPGETVFSQIPDDALFMLLPMWPGESDLPYDTNASIMEIPLQDRQYLLVYYVPFAGRDNEKGKKDGPETQVTTPEVASTVPTNSDNRSTVLLPSVQILARLVSHADVNGSGIRAPTRGLSVTGAFQEAVHSIPKVRFQQDDLAIMMAFCPKREKGVEFLPEAAEKLGLCMPRTNPNLDAEIPLNPLGRAACEMAWLGAMAVLSFPQSVAPAS